MFENLLNWDYGLFFYMNNEIANPFYDLIFPVIRNKYTWVPLYTFILSYLVINHKKKGFYFFLFMIITITVADQVSSGLIKPAVERLRPCNDIMWTNIVRNLVHCGSGYSFPSSHATNHFAIAFFLIFSFRKNERYILMGLLVIWASLISIGQVYVGVHYPIDILAGCLLGIIIGAGISLLARRLLNLRI